MTQLPESLVSSCKMILADLGEQDRDLFLYSGSIDQKAVNDFFLAALTRQEKPRSNISLILTTWGGDAHQAYRMAWLLQQLYSTFRVVVLGPCKSAGTLVAVGAHELAFGLFGELGPLDIQLTKPDEIAVTNSGLDTLGALAIMRSQAFNSFEEHMVDIINKSHGLVSMKTASDMASQLVIGLFRPMIQQIDPHRLSEVNRMMRIAREYGKKLGMPNLKDDKESQLDHLIEDYPSHGFIIDKDEAGTIFNTVLEASEHETHAAMIYPHSLTPSDETKVIDIGAELEKLVAGLDGDKMEETENGETTAGQTGPKKRRASRKGSKASHKGIQEDDQPNGEDPSTLEAV